jgi:hypothetical protein
MGRAISEVLPFAIGVAISPVPIIAALALAAGLVVFVVFASLTIAVPVVFSLGGGERAADVLDGWRVWLAANNTAVMAVLFVVFGTVLFSQGLRGLT